MDDQPQAESQQAQEPSIEELQAQELEKLEQSFTKVSSYKDPLKHEQVIAKESRDLNISLDEYRRLYELSRKKSSTPKKILNGFWRWTGFGEKKLWDFLQLLLVPLFIYGATSYLQDQAKKREEDAQKQTKLREKQAAADRANQETLSSYLDVMTKLLLDSRQKATSSDREQVTTVRVLAKTRTLTALRTLDSERRNQLLDFLRESKLIGKESSETSRIDFKNANLRGADLKNTDLGDINLSTVNLAGADLEGAKLIRTDLRGADLTDAKLEGANFSSADLTGAVLGKIEKVAANFCGATMPDGKKRSQGCSTYVTAGVGLAVRDSPAGKVIGGLGYGTQVSLTGAEVYQGGRTWLQLANRGWIVSDYLSIQPSVQTPANK